MTTTAKALRIGCSTALLLISTAASAQEACKSYVAVQGDHLRGISRAAYGDPDLYRLIFDANRDVIGSNADLILIGTELTIPCKPDGTGAVTSASGAATATASTETAATETASTEPEAAEDPAATGLITEVIDPAKEPVVIVPELPVVSTGAEVEIVTVEEGGTVTTTEPAPATETAAAPEATTEAEAPAATETTATETATAEEAAPATTETEVAAAETAPAATTETATTETAVAETTTTEPAATETAAAGTATTEPAATETATAETATETAAAEPAATETAAVITQPEAPTAPVDMGPIKIVTGNSYAPFADEMLPGGGMFTQIVEMGIFRADPDQAYSLTFVNDWQAHIDALLPSGAYDLSFPWMRPNCEKPEMLSIADRARCEDFVFSAPYYEVVDGFFAAAESDLAASTEYAEFTGKRICRPEAYTTGVLDDQGLTKDKVTLSRPQEAETCFEMLKDGDVDLVSIDTAVGDLILKHMGLTGKFVQNQNLTNVSTLHVIAYKSNARAVEMLRKLDDGVLKMNQSGEWWDIVSHALAEE